MWTCLTTIGCVYESGWVSAQIARVESIYVDGHHRDGRDGGRSLQVGKMKPLVLVVL